MMGEENETQMDAKIRKIGEKFYQMFPHVSPKAPRWGNDGETNWRNADK